MTRERPGLSFPASKLREHEQCLAHGSNTFSKTRAAKGLEPSCRVRPAASNTKAHSKGFADTEALLTSPPSQQAPLAPLAEHCSQLGTGNHSTHSCNSATSPRHPHVATSWVLKFLTPAPGSKPLLCKTRLVKKEVWNRDRLFDQPATDCPQDRDARSQLPTSGSKRSHNTSGTKQMTLALFCLIHRLSQAAQGKTTANHHKNSYLLFPASTLPHPFRNSPLAASLDSHHLSRSQSHRSPGESKPSLTIHPRPPADTGAVPGSSHPSSEATCPQDTQNSQLTHFHQGWVKREWRCASFSLLPHSLKFYQ